MIEDIIRNHKTSFEEDLPKGHVKRFSNKLSFSFDSKWRTSLNRYLVVAASVVVLITFGYIALLTSDVFLPDHDLLVNLTPELHETEMYYQNEINQKIDILSGQNHADETILDDLKEIDKSFTTIKKDLDDNPGDERLISAILNTYQIKLDLLNEILERLK